MTEKKKRYRVFHKDRPDDFVIVEVEYYSPMEIKDQAIKNSDKFDWGDYPDLRIKRVKGRKE